MSYKYATLAPFPGGQSQLEGVLRLMAGPPLQLASGLSLRLMSTDATGYGGASTTLVSVSKGAATLASVDETAATTVEVSR